MQFEVLLEAKVFFFVKTVFFIYLNLIYTDNLIETHLVSKGDQCYF